MKSFYRALKISYTTLLLLIFSASYCQDYKKLTIDDFKGIPDVNTPYAAFTSWRVSYKFKPSKQPNKYDFLVTLKIVPEKTWIKKDKISSDKYLSELLSHEQGHFAIGALMQKEALRVLSSKTYTSDFRNEMKEIFYTLLAKYKKLEIDYDTETNHMKNKDAQRKWDTFFRDSKL